MRRFGLIPPPYHLTLNAWSSWIYHIKHPCLHWWTLLYVTTMYYFLCIYACDVKHSESTSSCYICDNPAYNDRKSAYCGFSHTRTSKWTSECAAFCVTSRILMASHLKAIAKPQVHYHPGCFFFPFRSNPQWLLHFNFVTGPLELVFPVRKNTCYPYGCIP